MNLSISEYSLICKQSAIIRDYCMLHSLFPLRILLLQLLQNVDLQLGSLPVLVHVLDDLQRQHLPCVQTY